MLKRIKAEPALFSGLVLVLLNLAAAFGLNLTGEQTAAINAVVAALLAFFTRSQVTPVDAPANDPGEDGAADTVLLLLVGIFVGVLLLLFGVRFG